MDDDNYGFFKAGRIYAEGTADAKHRALAKLTDPIPECARSIGLHLEAIRDKNHSFGYKLRAVKLLNESATMIAMIGKIVEDLCAIEKNEEDIAEELADEQ